MSAAISAMFMLLAELPANPGGLPPAVPQAPADPGARDQDVPIAPQPASPIPPIAPEPATEVEEGAIVVKARHHATPGDPLEVVNAKSFEITQDVDRAIIRPVARGYQRVLPAPARDGIRNLINNLREPVAFLNFLLQLKPGKAAETAGRFVINSTVGVAGLFDIAKRRPFRLPRRPNGLANTFGYYGVKTGPFLFVPLVGPTTLRDLIGDGLDRLFLPVAIGKPFNKPAYGIPIYIASSLDQRAEFDEKLQALHEDSIDPYTATREDYLAHRQAAIDALHSARWRAAHPRGPAPQPDLAPAQPPAPAATVREEATPASETTAATVVQPQSH